MDTFPEYEESITSGGTSTQRSSYYLAGQLIDGRVRTTGAGTLYYAYGDHLGSIAIWTYSGGTPIGSSTARYEPYGGYRTTPTGGNPVISDRGFTGHRHNNTGSYDLGLIYMNARYYLPGIGRFISADTIVPDPKVPQSHNRYAYALNSPTNFTDPTGHCGAEAAVSGGDTGFTEYAQCIGLRSELEGLLGHSISGIWYLWQMQAMHEGGFALSAQGIALGPQLDPNGHRAALQALTQYWSANASVTSLEISARVVEFGSALGSSVEDLIAVLSGHVGDGVGRPNDPFRATIGDTFSTEKVLGNRSSGFNADYADPNPGNNQVHHTWYWIQVAYYNSDLVAFVGNLYHEYGGRSIRDGLPPEDGQSIQDYRAGTWGIGVGRQLARGQLTFFDLANKLRVDLGGG